MLLRIVGRMLLVITATGLLLAAAEAKDSKKEDGIKGTIVKVDMSRNAISVKIDNRRETFFVTADTKYFDSDGAISEDGIRDERLAVGKDVRIVADLGGKTANEVHLASRKIAAKGKTVKAKDADDKSK